MKKVAKLLLLVLCISVLTMCLVACGEETQTHVWNEWEMTKVVTCTEKGAIKRTCSDCDEVETGVVKALGHDLEHYEAKEATCIEIGWDAYDKCKRAGCDYSTYEEIIGTHKASAWIIDVEATCTEKGSKHKECTVCGEELDVEEIDYAHVPSAWIVDKEATCTETGTRHKECTVCHNMLTTETIALSKHTPSNWIVDKEATCTTDGTKYQECTVCHTELVKETIPANGHTPSDWIVDRAVTCTVDGTRHKECTVCHAELEREELKASHTTSDWIVDTEATCTEDGAKHRECMTCGYIIEEVVLPATGHTFNDKECDRCHVKQYDLTIKYVYSDGEAAYASFTHRYIAGEKYHIESPVKDGYIVDIAVVQGVIVADTDVTVTYKAIENKTYKIVSLRGVDLGDVPYNTSFKALALPDMVEAVLEDESTMSVNVIWSKAGYVATEYGKKTISGTVYPPYGYELQCENSVTASANVQSILITEIPVMDLGKLPLGTSYEGLGLPTTAEVHSSEGYVYYLPVTWSSYEYDSTVAGKHTMYGELTLETGFAFRKGVEGKATIEFELSERMYGTADIVFIVDTTGSMSDEINNVKTNIKTFASNLETAGISVRWALLEYRDITCDGDDSTKIIYNGSSEWYIDVNAYKQAIASLSVNGGGDREETVIDALKMAGELDSRAEATTFYIVVTDADYKVDNNYGITSMEQMIDELVRERVITSVVTNTCFYNIYRDLTDSTEGILANIYGNFVDELMRLMNLIEDVIKYGTVERIEIATQPAKTEYKVGDYFDGSGMVVKAYYTSGLSREISGYSVSPNSALQVSNTSVEINYRGATATVAISVVVPEYPVTGLTLDKTSIEMVEGDAVTVKATVTPSNASNKNVIWYTGNPNIATVEDGVIKAWSVGEAKITVITADGGFSKTVTVKVTKKIIRVTDIYLSISAKTIDKGTTVTIEALVLPLDATNVALSWSSSDENVVTVDNGVITAVNMGSTTVIAKATDGSGVLAKAYIVVVHPASHSLVPYEAQAPSCTEIGWDTYVICEDCDYTTYVEIPALGHTPSDWIVDKTATCTVDGVKHKECTVCNITLESETIFAAHKPVNHDAQAATCTDIGWDAYVTCENCDYTTYVEIEALGHNYVDGACTRCGDKVIVGTEGLSYSYDASSESYTVTGYTGTSTEVVIPTEYDDGANGTHFVGAIGVHAFERCSSLTSIYIPSSVTEIGNSAFGYCTGLTSVHISDMSAWCGISFGSSYANPLYYAHNLYLNGELVTDLVVPDDVTDIKNYAFYECRGLTSITIPDSVTEIGDCAFRDCTGLTSVTIGGSITTIGDEAFQYCYKLIEVYNKSSLNITCGSEDNGYVGYYAKNVYTTEGGSKLTTDSDGYVIYTDGTDKILVAYVGSETQLTLPSDITEIYKYAFYGCTGLTSVTIGDSVTEIGSYAFYKCTGLTSITIPDSVTTIGESAFYGCTKLAEIAITDSVTSVGVEAFAGTAWYNAQPDGVIYIGKALYKYKGTMPENTSIVIKEGTTQIVSWAFGGCTGLTSVTIGNSVTEIGYLAFCGCTGLTSVTIGSSVTEIGYLAFEGCTGLTSVTIPDSVTTIGDWAFEDCTGLTSVTIGSSVTTIGDRAFLECYKLIEVYNKSSLNITCGSEDNGYVGYYAKNVYTTEGGSKLTTDSDGYVIYTDGTDKILVAYVGSETKLTLPSGITAINQGAFYKCTGLTSVTIGDSVTTIGDYAFSHCTGLTSVTIPNSVTEIGNWAFDGCTGLTSVTIPDSVTTIGDYAFSECYKLIEVYNKSSLNITCGSKDNGYVGYHAKNVYTTEGGSKLTTDSDGYVIYMDGSDKILVAYRGSETDLTLPSDITEIYKYAFYGCTGLTSVTIGNSVTTIGSYAFGNCKSLTEIHYNGTKEQWKTIYKESNWDGGATGYRILYLGNESAVGTEGLTYSYDSSSESYIVTGYTGTSTEVVIPTEYDDGANGTHFVGAIGVHAFERCSSLTSIYIPSHVTTIGDMAFSGCFGLSNITIPDGITSVGSRAFNDTAWYNNLPSGTVYIGKVFYKYNGVMPDNTSIILKYGTTEIADSAFEYCAGLTSITIPDSVTTIGYSAFGHCTGLKSITIPDNVTTIGNHAFSDCMNLTAVYVSDINVWFGIHFADQYANPVYYAHNLYANDIPVTDLVIPSDVTKIQHDAFHGCTSLKSVTICDAIIEIGGSAFSGCDGLEELTVSKGNTKYHSNGNCVIETDTKTLIVGCKTSVIPSDGSVTAIGEGAFEDHTCLTRVNIPYGVKAIGYGAFWGCTNLASVDIPSSVTTIEWCVFYGCTNLTDVIIPDGVTTIGWNLFHGCISLKSIAIPAGVIEIGNWAFADCKGLTSVTIPDSVTTIGSYVFRDCKSLTEIHYNGTKEQWKTIYKESNWDGGATGYRILYLGNESAVGTEGLTYSYDSSSESYTVTGYTGTATEVIIPAEYDDGTNGTHAVRMIGDFVFEDNTNLTSVAIPNGIIAIGDGAFYVCSGLTSVDIPDSVTTVGESAFYGCTKLAEIAITDSVTSVGVDAFYNTAWYDTQPDGVIYIGKALYKYKGTMPENTSIVIKEGTTQIVSWAFGGCTGLTSMIIPDSVTSVGREAFFNTDWYDSQPDGVVYIGKALYKYKGTMPKDTEIVIKDDTKSITELAFSGCSNLMSVTIPSSVSSIGHCAFYNCWNLRDVIIPTSVTSMGVNVLYGTNVCGGTHTPDANCVCTVCGNTAHTFDTESHGCIRCDALEPSYVKETLATEPYVRNNSVIYFGSYPQTRVDDSTLHTALSTLAGALPTADDSGSWTSYGYYISSSVSNYMWYIDKEYNGEKYRGIYFTSYRPRHCTNSSSASNSYQDDNGYYTSTIYWFKYEPIKWSILTESDGKAMILADLAIDGQSYDACGNYGDYDNNYANSAIRTWLNATFYNTAFSSLQKELIETTNVDNSVASTYYSSNDYICSDTSDNVFLLSCKEVLTYFTMRSEIRKKNSDYAKSQGIYLDCYCNGTCDWILRSPGNSEQYCVRCVLSVGVIYSYHGIEIISGILPALIIKLS